MSDNNQTNPEGGRTRNSRKRRPKNRQSHEFHEILDAALQLSVAERVRLIKALSGIQGLTTVKPVFAIDKNMVTEKETKEPLAPNPLKNTVFQKAVDDARAALQQEKNRLGLDKVPEGDPHMMRLRQAIDAYKAEHQKLVPVKPSSNAAGARLNKKRPASKSPIRGTNVDEKMDIVQSSTGSGSAIGSAMNVFKRIKGKIYSNGKIVDPKVLTKEQIALVVEGNDDDLI